MAGATLTPSTIAVVPGAMAVTTVRIRNSGAVVDSYTVSVLGDAANWSTVIPPMVSLFPGGEGEVQVHFNPPRMGSLGTGPLDFGIRVLPSEDPDGAIVEEGVLDIQAFTEVEARITPRTSESKRTAKHEVIIDNKGNSPVEAEVDASDPDEHLAFDVRPRVLTVPPASSGSATVKVAAKKGFLKGPQKMHPFTVEVRAGDDPPRRLDGAMNQKPGLPRFVVPVIMAVAVVGALALAVPALQKSGGSNAITLTNDGKETTTTVADEEEEVAAPVTTPADAGGAGGGEAQAPVSPGPTAPRSQTTVTFIAPTTTARVTVETTAPSGGGGGPAVTSAPAVAPSRIVFTSNRSGKEILWSMNGDGSGQAVFLGSDAEDAWVTHASWSKDRQWVVFNRNRSNSDAKIWIMQGDGRGQRQLSPAGGHDAYPRMSPDGSKIAYISNRQGGQFDIWVMGVDGSSPTNLTPGSPGSEHNPTWSPDGKTIAYQKDAETWLMDANGANQRKLLTGTQPSWHPTEQKLVFNNGGNVAIYNFADARVTNLQPGASPWWNQDGTKIVFGRPDRGPTTAEIFLMNADGSEVKQLTTNGNSDYYPTI